MRQIGKSALPCFWLPTVILLFIAVGFNTFHLRGKTYGKVLVVSD